MTRSTDDKADELIQTLRRQGFSDDEIMEVVSRTEAHRQATSSFRGKLSDRAANRLVPDFRRVPTELANQPQRAIVGTAQQGSSLGIALAKWGALGATGVAAGVAGVPALADYMTERGISQNEADQLTLAEKILNDDGLTHEQRMALLDQLDSISERRDTSGGGVFDLSLPGLGNVHIGPATMLFLLIVVAIAGRAYVSRGGG